MGMSESYMNLQHIQPTYPYIRILFLSFSAGVMCCSREALQAVLVGDDINFFNVGTLSYIGNLPGIDQKLLSIPFDERK